MLLGVTGAHGNLVQSHVVVDTKFVIESVKELVSVQMAFRNKKEFVVLPIVKFMVSGPSGHHAQQLVLLKVVKNLRKRETEIVW